MGGGKPVDDCRRVPAPFIATQPNVIMEGTVSKQTSNRNWPPRFAFLTTDAIYFYATRSSEIVKGVVPLSSSSDVFDMPKGPGLMSGFFFSIVGHCSKAQKSDKLLSYYDGHEFYIRCETKEEKTCWMNAIGLVCAGKPDSARAYAKKLAKVGITADIPKPAAPAMRASTASVVSSSEPQLCTATVCYATEESSFPEPTVTKAPTHRPSHRPPPPPRNPPPPPPTSASSSGGDGGEEVRGRSSVPSYLKKNNAVSSPSEEPQPPPVSRQESMPVSAAPRRVPSYMTGSASGGGGGGNTPGYLSRPSASTSNLYSPPNKPVPPQNQPSSSGVINRGPAPRKTLEQTRAQAKGQHHAVPGRSNSVSNSSSGVVVVSATTPNGYDICFICQNAIVMSKERVLVDGKFPAHAGCFKCAACAKTLDPVAHDYDMFEGMYYCLPHYNWILEQVRKEQEQENAGSAEERDPNAPKKWKMDWTTKKWRIE